jgi:hypothetical protein
MAEFKELLIFVPQLVVFQNFLCVIEVNKHKLWLGLQLSNVVLFIYTQNKTGVNKFYKNI